MGATEDRNKEIVQRYWDALAQRDWDGMKALLTDDAHYTDVGTVGAGGTGPDGVVNRVKIGLEPLEGYEHLPGTSMIAEGDLVMTEHTERWIFHTGEVIDHSFVSVTQLRDGKIFLIDFEVVHWGDPAFDAAFFLNHLFLKALYRPEFAPSYFDAAREFWKGLAAGLGGEASRGAAASR